MYEHIWPWTFFIIISIMKGTVTSKAVIIYEWQGILSRILIYSCGFQLFQRIIPNGNYEYLLPSLSFCLFVLVFVCFFSLKLRGVLVSHHPLWKSVTIYIIALVIFLAIAEGSLLSDSLLLTDGSPACCIGTHSREHDFLVEGRTFG